MPTQEEARSIAESALREGTSIDSAGMREIEQGWFFPFRSNDGSALGTVGVIVNKESGNVFRLGCTFPIERDLTFYDKGYQFARYNLVILEIRDLDQTIDTLLDLRISVAEDKPAHGATFKVLRPLAKKELELLLKSLPCVFGGINLYYRVESLENATHNGWFTFQVGECQFLP